MEGTKSLDVFKLFEENKKVIAAVAIILFFVLSKPTKASIFFGVVFCIAGLAVRAVSFVNEEGEGADSLTTSGIYSYVRNPKEVGAFIVGSGVFIMGNTCILKILLIIALIVIYKEKIKVKEEKLKERFKEKFEDYAFNVPSVLPRLTPWEKGSKISFDRGLFLAQKEYWGWLIIYLITIVMFLKS